MRNLRITLFVSILMGVAAFHCGNAQSLSAAVPERPWIHRYDQTLTMKFIVAVKKEGGGTRVILDLDRTLAVIQKIDQLTLGMPKIVYLVGWQYDGHDSKYPAFFEVNSELKRPGDATALDSLKWLMREARQYHTTVSVHINLRDAYKSSPLWEEYATHDLLMRGPGGQLKLGGFWGGEQAYLVCYTREWDAGYTQKRLNRLLDLLPIEDAGTIHIDAFHTDACEGQGITREQETETQKKIIRYLRDRKIDVTSEFFSDFRIDPLIGLQPMAWWFRRQELPDYLARPASVLTGGVDETLGGKLFGTSMHGEEVVGRDAENLSGFLREFCLQTVPWYFLNHFERQRIDISPEASEAFFSGGVMTRVSGDGRITITENGRVLRDGDDILMPASWRQEPSMIAYSAAGYASRTWQLPDGWEGRGQIDVAAITPTGLRQREPLRPVGGRITLTMGPDEALLLSAHPVGQ